MNEQPPSPLPSWSINLHKALQIERRAAKDARRELRETRYRVKHLEHTIATLVANSTDTDGVNHV